MIDRYTTPEMAKIWSDENKYETWKKVEITVTEVLSERGDIPKEAVKVIKEKAAFSVERILEIEQTTRHDVIAFLTNLAENIGPESRFIHMGMTSSDLLDTSLALLCKEAGEIILDKLQTFKDVLRKQAVEHKESFQIGRSHGVHAEPITFGLKLALWSEEIGRHIDRWERAVKSISTGKISGAVGTYQHLDPEVEEESCKRLGLQSATVSNQVVQRDHHAEYLTTLANIAASLEKIAVEIRHLQRTEVLEVEEYFEKGQKGSSAMPHKKNPILSENLTGLSRMVRSYVVPALENIALWHERDISHSSVERNIGPDANITLDFALVRLNNILNNMIVYPKKMISNLNITKGVIFSQEIMLELTKSGISREKSYEIIQSHAKRCLSQNLNLFEVVKKDKLIMDKISLNKLKKIFNYSSHLKNVNLIFNRVFK